jgi:hypothetical protein
MWETYAKILGQHAADILNRLAGGGPFHIRLSDLPLERPVCELAVSINFRGKSVGWKRVNGYLVCGARLADIRPLLTGIAAHLGLDAGILETEAGLQDLLDEFLNIIIGLTGADWAEHGFEMSFSTPHILSGRDLPPRKPQDQAFHVVVHAQTGIQLDIMVVFNPCPKLEFQPLKKI